MQLLYDNQHAIKPPEVSIDFNLYYEIISIIHQSGKCDVTMYKF